MNERGNVRQRKGGGKTVTFQTAEDDTKDVGKTFGWGAALCWGILAAVVLTPLVIVLMPSPIDPVSFKLPEPPEFTGPLEPNTHLQKAERIYENQLKGPESIVVDGEHIYTGTADGKVLHIYRGEIQVLAKLGKDPCGSFQDEPTCGRPLGMRMDKDGYLVVVDTYLGLYRINVATGDVYQLWSSTTLVNGRRAVFLNDLTIAKDGTMYLTDSSSKWDRRHNRYHIMEAQPTGRLLKFDESKKEMTELVGGIDFANGVQLTKKEDAVLICETTRARLLRYILKGPNAGTLEVINDNLPGLPDNIRPSTSGGYWIGFALTRRKGKFSFTDFCADKPLLRSIIMKVIPLDAILAILPKYGLIVEVDEMGNILQSLHDPTGKVIPSTSEIEDKNGVLHMGSYQLPFMGRLYMARIKKT